MDAQLTRTRLEERLTLLTKREAALSKHLRGQDGRLTEDSSDRASLIEADEVIEQLDDEARSEIGAIEGALQRLGEGNYGTCVSCGENIASKRLEVLPHTAQCVACAA